MKTKAKVLRAGLFVLFGGVLATATLYATVDSQQTAEAETNWSKYYYSQLTTPESQKFYNAIGEMEQSGMLAQGNAEYDLVANNVLTQTQLKTYSESVSILESFCAGRDAYFLDHPAVFYIDYAYLSISVGTKSDGSYVATLGTGRSDNYYLEGGFTSQEAVTTAKTKFDSAVSAVVTAAQAKSTDVEKIQFVNEALMAMTEYSYGTTADASGTNYKTSEDGTQVAAFIHTAYGALVNGESVCEGYSRSFKAIMDELNIPCLLVQGYASPNADGNYEPHMWNYVMLDNKWYGVDVTWNDGYGVHDEAYLLRGNVVMREDHVAGGVLTASGKEFDVPALTPYDYGETGIDGFDETESYIQGTTAGSQLWMVGVSYNGKNSQELLATGKYLAYRISTAKDTYSAWTQIDTTDELCQFEDEGHYTQLVGGAATSMRTIQFAVLNKPADGLANAYSDANLQESDFIEKSEEYANAYYGTHNPPPYAVSTTPDNKDTELDVSKTYDITITYDEDLKLADDSLAYGMIIADPREESVVTYSSITNVKWSADNPREISFTFQPSQRYEHHYERYTFQPTNLIGVSSEEKPHIVTYVTCQKTVVCNKVFNDGRLYMDIYGEPSLVGTGDMSLTGWKTEDGNYVADNQRSQMVLVATKPTAAESDEMVDGAANAAGVDSSKVLSSATFNLDLNICSKYTEIPAGSYMKLAFGFPEGFGPEDEGVTFQVYHFKKNSDGSLNYDEPEILDCVITEYGLIVTVTSFSPFAIIAVNKSDVPASTTRNIYAESLSTGGTLVADSQGIIKVSQGATKTFTFVPADGYQVDRVLLNEKPVTVTNNTYTVSYDDLAENNTLQVTYVAKSVMTREAEQGITVVYPALKATSTSTTNPATTDDSGSVAAVVVLCCVLGVVVIGLAVVLILIARRRTAEATVDGTVVSSSAASNGATEPKKTSTKTSSKKTATGAGEATAAKDATGSKPKTTRKPKE